MIVAVMMEIEGGMVAVMMAIEIEWRFFVALTVAIEIEWRLVAIEIEWRLVAIEIVVSLLPQN